MNADYTVPNISVDVIPLWINKTTGKLRTALWQRTYEPFAGSTALAGVLLVGGELIRDAVERAVTGKLGLGDVKLRHLLEVGVFDEPNRDPRGATIALAFIAVFDGDAAEEALAAQENASAIDLQEALQLTLPFDHISMLTRAVQRAGEAFMKDRDFTRALIGSTATTKLVRQAMAEVSTLALSLKVESLYPNLARAMRSMGWEESAEAVASTGSRGRPSKSWTLTGG